MARSRSAKTRWIAVAVAAGIALAVASSSVVPAFGVVPRGKGEQSRRESSPARTMTLQQAARLAAETGHNVSVRSGDASNVFVKPDGTVISTRIFHMPGRAQACASSSSGWVPVNDFILPAPISVQFITTIYLCWNTGTKVFVSANHTFSRNHHEVAPTPWSYNGTGGQSTTHPPWKQNTFYVNDWFQWTDPYLGGLAHYTVESSWTFRLDANGLFYPNFSWQHV